MDLDQERGLARAHHHACFAEEISRQRAIEAGVDDASCGGEGGEDAVAIGAVNEQIDVRHRARRGRGVDGERERGALHEQRRQRGSAQRARDLGEHVGAEERLGVGGGLCVRGGGEGSRSARRSGEERS